MGFDELLNTCRNNAAQIDEAAKKLGIDLQTYFDPQIVRLNDCLDTYSAAKVLIATVVADCRGELSLEGFSKLANNFDKNWDKFAAEFNQIFNHSSGTQQANILETFARTHFGDSVFENAGVIKNETPDILSGITDFKQGLDSFKGSYRNPVVAATKIRNGVNAIVGSTSKVATSLNNVLKAIQKNSGQTNPVGNVILQKLGTLPNMKAIVGATSILNAGVSGMTTAASAQATLDSLKRGDIKGVVSSGKATIKNAKDTINNLKNIKGKSANLARSPIPSNNAEADNAADNDDNNDSNSDSYVCSKAKIKCSYGDKISTLTVFPDRTISLTGEFQANISDHLSMQNIAPFGKCHTTSYPATGSATAAAHGKLTPMPCVPNTPFPWMNGKNDVLLKGQPALLKSSSCKCIWGGVITITNDGQKDGTGTDIVKIPPQSSAELDIEAYKIKNGEKKPKMGL